jgi:microcystin-dependent protein
MLNHTGAFFDNGSGGLSTDGFLNTLAGDIDVQLQGVLAATFQRTGGANFFKVFGSQTVSGSLAVTGTISGPGITPIGACVMWFDDTLPTDGLWVWANGQIISNANVVAPVLLARWGSRFGGNGVTTMGVPDMQDVVPVGKDGMGGAAGNSLLSSIASSVKGVINSIFGADTTTLITANLPPYTPAGTITNGAITSMTNNISSGATGGALNLTTGGFSASGTFTFGSSGFSMTQAASTFTGSAQGGSSTPISRLQPSKVVNWIIRIG